MTVISVQRVYESKAICTEQRVYETSIDPKTMKQTVEITVYRLYNQQGQIEETPRSTVDLRA
jgi:hypothetical protein